VDVSNQALRFAGIALSHAWALKSFAGEYPPSRVDLLAEPERLLANEVVQEHAAELKTSCSALLSLLSGVVDSEAEQGIASRASIPLSSWQTAAPHWLELVREIHADASDLFSCGRGVEDRQSRASRMMRRLNEMKITTAK